MHCPPPCAPDQAGVRPCRPPVHQLTKLTRCHLARDTCAPGHHTSTFLTRPPHPTNSTRRLCWCLQHGQFARTDIRSALVMAAWDSCLQDLQDSGRKPRHPPLAQLSILGGGQRRPGDPGVHPTRARPANISPLSARFCHRSACSRPAPWT